MKILAEAQPRVIKLWGKQAAKPGERYRLMKYVLRVEHEGHTALHNVMTGQLILLDEDEIRLMDTLPAKYSQEMDALVADHYLVPEGYDEYKQLCSLRTILRKLTPPVKAITHYTILPTTACNARCYYCFEQGSKIITMTEQTAEDTVRFIAEHCGEDKKVHITWFGGEPTVAANRIDQICRGLQREGISYTGMMYTNGYLFDEGMADRASELWHVKHMQIVIDGTEELYNRIKNYVNPQDNPYQRVMRNIGLLLEREIGISVRMNVDRINYESFEGVAQELVSRYPNHQKLSMYAYPIIGDYSNEDADTAHAEEKWIAQKVLELNAIAQTHGLASPSHELPSLRFWNCPADNDGSMVIHANGFLMKCSEHFTDADAVGTISEGITDAEKLQAWRKTYNSEMCFECCYAPRCLQLEKCSAAGRCYRHQSNQRYIWAIKQAILAYFVKEKYNYGIQGTQG